MVERKGSWQLLSTKIRIKRPIISYNFFSSQPGYIQVPRISVGAATTSEKRDDVDSEAGLAGARWPDPIRGQAIPVGVRAVIHPL